MYLHAKSMFRYNQLKSLIYSTLVKVLLVTPLGILASQHKRETIDRERRGSRSACSG
jgi:hypothetical protein